MDAASPATVVGQRAGRLVLVPGGEGPGELHWPGGQLGAQGSRARRSNITDSYNSLIKRRPPAVRQVQKSGTTKQARKRYRLTESASARSTG